MINTIYTATTGLEGFSRGLALISENVSNLNTTGFKQQRLDYFDLGSGDQQSVNGGGGDGLETSDPYRQFKQGDIRRSDNELDTAIAGAGFFIAEREGERLLTRAGQFALDKDYNLTFRDSGATVIGFSGSQLVPISLASQRTNPAKATTSVTFNGPIGFSSDATTLPEFNIYDSAGVAHVMRIELSKIFAGQSISDLQVPLNVNIFVDGGTAPVYTAQIRYSSSQATLGFSVINDFVYTPPSGSGSLSIKLDFSQTSLSTASSMSTDNIKVDGHGVGGLQKISFNAKGELLATYDNGEKATVGQLALGNTFELEKLEAVDKNLFSIKQLTDFEIGRPGLKGLGQLQTGSLEASNVELTAQFSELIVVQRAYQASSQVITTTNEMLAVLFDVKGRR